MLAHLKHQRSLRPLPEKRKSKEQGIQAQAELITKQKWEIENLKAAKATRVSLQLLVSAIPQAMSCLFVCNKKTSSDNQSNGGNKFAGMPRPPKPLMGIDWSLDTSLMC